MYKEESFFQQLDYCKKLRKERLEKNQKNIKYSLTFDTLYLPDLYKKDIENNEGFLIKPFDYSNVVQNFESALLSDSIFSEKFGVRSNDPESVLKKRFKCECGRTESPQANVMCEHCHTYTKLRNFKRGWIKLNEPYKVFSPFYLMRLIFYLPKEFKEAKEKKRMTSKIRDIRNGKVRERVPFQTSLSYYDSERKLMFNMLNLTDVETLIKFINLYVKNEGGRVWLLKNIHKAYTNYIPVINKKLRHFFITGNGISDNKSVEQHPLNPLLMIIDNAVNTLNKFDRESVMDNKINTKLTTINKHLIKLIPIIFKETSEGKKCDMRERVNGRRVDNSFRNILEGISHYRSDVCTLSYRTFGKIFMSELEDKYIEWGMTPEARSRIMEEIPLRKDLVLMQKGLKYLRENKLNYIVIKRSPCIIQSSILSVEIVGLTFDGVIRTSIQVLDLFNGDKDGDVIAGFVVAPSVRYELYLALNPRNFAINRINMSYSGNFKLKDVSHLQAYKMLDDGLTEEEVFSLMN